LRTIERLKSSHLPNDKFRSALDKVIAAEGLNEPLRLTLMNDEATVDEVSHYILRISYCQSEDLRKWFLQQECELMRHRLNQLFHNANAAINERSAAKNHSHQKTSSSSSLTQSLQRLFQLQPLSKQEKEDSAEALKCLLDNPQNFHVTPFYKVPFLDALDLISQRECYVHAGMAYVTQPKLVAILVQKFRTHLSHCLIYMCHHTKHIHAPPSRTDQSAEAERLGSLLRNLSHISTNPEEHDGADGALATAGLTANTLLQYRDNMPLCMRQLQVGMQQDHKLKHWGRLQYGLFLKGAGLSLEDALSFFQRHFTAVTNEKFQKEYAYNIRHMYGKEGKRASYTPYNCSKIILGNAPATNGDHHGCPYKHYDVDHLDQLLRSCKINAADRNAIVKLKQSHQYQLACMKQFEVQHPQYQKISTGAMDNVGNHPNAWFRASILYKVQSIQ
jgi:DNA primase large subunit